MVQQRRVLLRPVSAHRLDHRCVPDPQLLHHLSPLRLHHRCILASQHFHLCSLFPHLLCGRRCGRDRAHNISIMPTANGQFRLTIEKAKKVMSTELPKNDSFSGEASLNHTMQLENRMMLIQLQLSTMTSASLSVSQTGSIITRWYGWKRITSSPVRRRRSTMLITPQPPLSSANGTILIYILVIIYIRV